MADNRERNKAAIRRLLKAVEIQDYAVIADCIRRDTLCGRRVADDEMQHRYDSATKILANR